MIIIKQHITPKQAKEISKEQFYSLFKNQHWETVDRENWADYHHKKVTIGKMIEILKDINLSELHYTFDSWISEMQYNGEYKLCDMLWENIKIAFNYRLQ